jgi:hypothetical protein
MRGRCAKAHFYPTWDGLASMRAFNPTLVGRTNLRWRGEPRRCSVR